MTVSIRTAIPTDIPKLREFEQGIVAAERPFDETLRPDPITYHDLESLVASADSEVAVAEISDQLVGCGYAAKRESRHYTEPACHAHLGMMYVAPKFRNRGINQHIMQHLLAWARQQGLVETRLTVYPDNIPATRAYEKAGFQAHILEMRLRLDD